jgi:hypothetical protein
MAFYLTCDECGKLVDKLYRCPCCHTGYCIACRDNINLKKNNCTVCEKQ